MRLLYVTATLPYGPSEVFALPEIAALRRRGHDVLVVPVRAGGALVHPEASGLVTEGALAGLGGRVLGVAAGRLGRPTTWSSIAALRSSSRSLPKNLAVLPKGLWVGELAREWRADHIHAYWASTPATVAMTASRDSGVPWSFTAHRWDIFEDNLLAAKASGAVFARFISQHGLTEAVRRGVAPGERAPVIHMGVEVPAEPAPQLPTDRFTLVCPASLVEVKRHDTLLAALASLGNDGPRLLLAGEGPRRSELEATARRLGISDRTEFLGRLPHGALLELYRSGRIGAAVLTSRIEGIPVALLEAMAHGVPVIATMVGGVPELLADGAGIGVPPGDPDGLAAAITRVASDRTLADRLGRAGRQRIIAEYDVEGIATALESRFAAAGSGG